MADMLLARGQFPQSQNGQRTDRIRTAAGVTGKFFVDLGQIKNIKIEARELNVMTTAPPAYKVAIDVVRQVLAFGREQGIPVDDIMSEYDFAIEALPGEPAYMSGPDVQKLLAVGFSLLPDPLPGLYAAKGQLASLFGLSAFVLQTSSTVGSMLQRLLQLEPLIGDTGLTKLSHEPGEVQLLRD